MTLISSILNATALVARLSQNVTNGKWFGSGYSRCSSAAEIPDKQYDVPNTDVFRHYNFDIMEGWMMADGVNKTGLYINGQFPGPTIEANWGDTIQVTVTNHIKDSAEATSMHWHGLLQRETPWFDGVPSISQCPIAPDKSFTYSFIADQYGTSWYHSHYSAQYADGTFGAMIIYGPEHVPYDIDVGPILLTDYFHTRYYPLVQRYTGSQDVPNSDNNLINGKMNFDCSLANGTECVPNVGLSKFKFESGKVHRLRLINAGAEALQKFTIDDHEMTLIAADFAPIKPYKTKVVTLGVGQRADVLVEGKDCSESQKAYWMRSDIPGDCSHANQAHSLAAIYYDDADTDSVPQSTKVNYNISSQGCVEDSLELTEPFFPEALPTEITTYQDINITFGANATGAMVWFANNISFTANYNHPLLLLAKEGNTSYPYDPQWNVLDFGKHKTIRLYVRNFTPLAHPMHLHGHNFWVLAQGKGDWDGTVTRPYNPQVRDVQIVEKGYPYEPAYIVIEYKADNPGIRPFHCHVAWHVSDGLYINLMENADLIKNRGIPYTSAQTCRE
ncbi:multicopper oxidase, putative [Talaromyces stipitatus ATCC 10500]|uniref:Multicopper oxidase, putative n=1 Tax=Talaromyces stipitatus (strain ATCC 10500 / CBS 375.48 / QM 6759 / NRRL 1006) TaxID=441959 RepID=B8MFE0_TALSN|nr:multicopper oxidase, putative [Talaromyces stipitatus ATCC 10500]EED16674.1 multicopper oxidase, putative [Talaromyces stipitatus ATCC 10500]